MCYNSNNDTMIMEVCLGLLFLSLLPGKIESNEGGKEKNF